MVQRLPDIQLQSGVAVSTNVPLFVAGYIIGNESGLSVTVEMQGLFNPKNLYPGTVDFFPCKANFSGNILINNVTMLSNVSSWPSSFLTVDMVTLQDKIDTSLYPMALPTRQTTTPTTSGNPIFSATYGVGTSANNVQIINVYNPANSGFLYEFHSCRVFTNNNQLGMSASLGYIPGPDNLFSTSIPAEPHDLSANPPVSTSNCTATDTNTRPGIFTIEVLDTQQNATLDFLIFPDKVRLWPGNNLFIVFGNLENVTPGTVIRMTMKWTEVPLTGILAASGGATTGNILTAANVVNNGNAVGTGIISAMPSGDSSNAVYLDNAGNLTLGDATNVGSLTIPGGAFNSKTGVYGQGTAGGFIEVVGSDGANSFQGRNSFSMVNASGQTDLIFASGRQTLNGSTSGTATWWMWLQGPFKMCFVQFSNFRQGTAVNQSFFVNTPFTTCAQVFAGDCGAFQLVLSGTPKTVNILTGLASTGGTTTAVTTVPANSIGFIPSGFDTFFIPGSEAAAHTGTVFIVGF